MQTQSADVRADNRPLEPDEDRHPGHLFGEHDLRPVVEAQPFRAKGELTRPDQRVVEARVPVKGEIERLRSLGGALTRREREVAELVARGLANRQIASELHLSERTVENHVSKILRKLGLSSRSQLSTWVTQRTLLSSDTN